MSAQRQRGNRFQGLRPRLVRTLFGGAVAILAVAFALTYALAHRLSSRDSLHTLEGLAAAVDGTLAIGAYARDKVLVQEVVEGLGHHPLVGSVQVIGQDGQDLARRSHDQADASATLRVERLLKSPFEPQESSGRLVITANMPHVLAGARRDALLMGAFMTGQALLLLGLLYWAVARRVSRPIITLAQELRDVTPGTSERLPTLAQHAHDEIGVLVAGANALLDTTERALDRERRLLAEMAELEARYRRIFEASSAGIFVLDRGGQLVAGNPTVGHLTGVALDAAPPAQGRPFIEQVFLDPRRVKEMIMLSKQRGEATSGDLELRPRDGRRVWVHCLLSAQGQGDSALIEGVMYDITARKSVEHTAMYHSQHDSLTGLKNRAGILGKLHRRVRSASRDGSPLTLLGMDLDGFKAVNDRHGHHAGDQVLVTCAQRMRTVAGISGPAVVGRVGGDEFMIVLEGLDVSNPYLSVICHTLLDSLRTPITLDDGSQVQVGASIGAAGLFHHARDAQQLIDAADQAMYAVKATGKNSHAVAVTRFVAPPAKQARAATQASVPMFADSLPMDALDMRVPA